MILLYAYIQQYKNYVRQEIIFDAAYEVSFADGILSICYRGTDNAKAILRGSKKPDSLRLLVGKTGSGKTNLLQLIGMKEDIRSHRMWEGCGDAYFFLYRISETEFFLEACNIELRQFPAEKERNDPTIPEGIRENAERLSALRTIRFSIPAALKVGERTSRLREIQEYGTHKARDVRPARELCAIINGYDIHAFIQPPYPDERDTCDDLNGSWLGRMAYPYHSTSLWGVCDYIREYLNHVESGSVKRQVSLVLSTHNFADAYPIDLPGELKDEYWTFAELKRDEIAAKIDSDAKKRLKKHKKSLKECSVKQMFLHDLWTDYAIYLRKWVERILSYQANEEIPEDRLDYSGTRDVYQEYIDYYAEREYHEDIDPTDLPDGQKMSIVKRCTWLAEFIDRADNGDPHGVLWQIIDDIKDIGNFLKKLDDRYFTIDTCTIPVVDMVRDEYKTVISDLFERMEQYIPDDAGIFSKELLPYSFTHLSTGEYQYAKVLGGLEEYLRLSFQGDPEPLTDRIILLDEPEAYMHPELARQFIKKLYEIVEKFDKASTVQIIIGTHSPFMLSDVLPSEITRLSIDAESGNAIVINGSDKAYFGANIHTILSDSFFLDYTIGEYSRSFLQEMYRRLEGYLNDHAALDDRARQDISSIRSFVPVIGDDLNRRLFELALEQLALRMAN